MFPILLLVLTAIVDGSPRKVRWYLAAHREEDNAAFIEQNAKSMTGVYACCNTIVVEEDGTVSTKTSVGDLGENAAPFLARGLTYHALLTPKGAGITTGVAMKGVAEIVRVAKAAGITGVLVDYEPKSNYSTAHAEAYAAFLRSLKEAGGSLEVGMDIAGWGILDNFPVYANANIDLYTSMRPTYDASLALTPDGKAFVEQMLGNFSVERAHAGIGSMPAEGFEENCATQPDHGWTAQNFPELLALGMTGVDVWRCDLNGYGETAPWLVESLAEFLAGSSSLTV